MRKICNLASVFAVSVGAFTQADAVINVDSYTYLTSPNSSYPDSSGIELTDGVDQTIAWGAGLTITLADVAPLVGWLNNSPSIRFDFGETVNLQSVTAWFADSNGSAGVGMPSSVTLRTDDMSFNQNFGVIDPAGDGTTVPTTISGLNVNTDHIILTATRVHSWTMLSEVTFSSVPEPSSFAAIAGVISLGWICLSRRRIKQ